MNKKEMIDEAKKLGIMINSRATKKEIEDLLKIAKSEVLDMDIKILKTIVPKDVEALDYENEEAWHELRKKRIGGSDVGAILGVNKWKSAVDVYLDKKGLTEFKGNNATYWGTILESTIIKEFAKLHKNYAVYTCNYSLVKGNYIANVDGLYRDLETGKFGVLEVKTTNQWNYKEWEGDTVPMSYYCQVQHYLDISGLEEAYIVVLIGGQTYKEFKILKSDEDIEVINKACDDFINNHLLKDEIPAPDGSSAYSEYLNEKIRFAELDGEVIELDNLGEDLEQYKEYSKTIKDLQDKQEIIKQKVKKELLDFNAKVGKSGNIKASITTRAGYDLKKFKADNEILVKNYEDKKAEYRTEDSIILTIR